MCSSYTDILRAKICSQWSCRVQALLAQGIFYVQLALIGLLVAGDWIFQALGVQPPEVYKRAVESKFLCIMVQSIIVSYCSHVSCTLCM